MSSVTIIGGGVIGTASALALQAEGYAVTLIDPGQIKRAASYGNCSLLAIGEIVPISRPGTLRKVPGWLLDPAGPLHVRPRSLATELPWLVRFLLAGRPARVKQIAAAMTPLLHRAQEDWAAQLSDANLSEALVQSENLIAMNSLADYEADQFAWGLRAEHGFSHRFVPWSELHSMEPCLGGPIMCAVEAKGWLQFSDPSFVLTRLQQLFVARGGELLSDEVTGIETRGRTAVAVTLGGGVRRQVDKLVLAAGAWSGALARALGLRVPVAALWGYHHQVANPSVNVTRPVLYANGGFVLTPLSSGLRIGGTIEIAGKAPKPNFARADMLADKARKVLPGLVTAGGEQWMGPRPFMPDTLPVIAPSPAQDNVVLAFGHGQVGQTLGATTGKLVAELVSGRKPSVDLAPYAPTRF